MCIEDLLNNSIPQVADVSIYILHIRLKYRYTNVSKKSLFAT